MMLTMGALHGFDNCVLGLEDATLDVEMLARRRMILDDITDSANINSTSSSD